MNHTRFDVLTRTLSGNHPRRQVLRSLTVLGIGIGLGAVRLPGVVEAKKRRPKRKPRRRNTGPKPNAFGCLDVGKPSDIAGQCCSSICAGKRCRAHGTGTCDQAAPGFCAAPDSAASLCGGSETCLCARTTEGSNFCAAPLPLCRECRRDTDCEAFGLPAGSACIPLLEGNCADNCSGDMACALPCGAEWPDPPMP